MYFYKHSWITQSTVVKGLFNTIIGFIIKIVKLLWLNNYSTAVNLGVL